MFAGVTTTAILVAFIADLLLSRRIAQSAGRRKVRLLRHHVIVVGLGSFGVRVVSDLNAAGYDVAVIESDDDNRYLPTAARLDVPVIFGDATLRQTLESARIEEARAVAVLTPERHGQHRGGHRAEGDARVARRAGSRSARGTDRPSGVRPDAGRGRRPAIRPRIRPLHSGSRSAVVHRRRDGAGCVRHLFGGATLVHGRRCARRPAARWMAWRWRTCRPKPASSRSPGPESRSGFILGATRHSAPGTPPTSSVLIGNCSTPCARDKVSGSRALIQRRQVEAWVSEPACAQLFQPPAIPLRRPARTPVADSDRNRFRRLGLGRSVKEARRRVGRAHPLLDHPHHLDHPHGLTNQCAHLVAWRHRGGRLRGPAVHPHVPTPARFGGVGSGLHEADRPQPSVHPGRLHAHPS